MMNPEWLRDYTLIQESLNGNEEAWEILYSESYPIVLGYTRKIYIKRYAEYNKLEEITDEAFRQCYQKRNTFVSRSKFTTWVCGFVRYVLLQYYKDYIKRQKLEQKLTANVPMYEYRSPDSQLIRKEQFFCIRTAFISLSKKHQLLLICYTLKKIQPSAIIGLTYTSHKKRMDEHKVALKTLRNRFLALYEKTDFRHDTEIQN